MTNRQQRRRREREAAKKLGMTKYSSDATPEEILPGSHGPVKGKVEGHAVTAILEALQGMYEGWDFTVMMFEPPSEALARGAEAPVINYGSTVSREDMLAVMRAYVKKNEDPAEYARMARIDEFMATQKIKGRA